MQSDFRRAIRTPPRLEWDEAPTNGAGERAHGFHRGSPRWPAASLQPLSRENPRGGRRASVLDFESLHDAKGVARMPDKKHLPPAVANHAHRVRCGNGWRQSASLLRTGRADGLSTIGSMVIEDQKP